jgi:hypothetical protein
VRVMLLNRRRVFVRGHLKHCVANWFTDHPPKAQLDVIHILLHEIIVECEGFDHRSTRVEYGLVGRRRSRLQPMD